MAGALTDQPAINALVCLRLALCQRGGQSAVFAVILPCPLEIAIPKLLLGPDHSNGVQPENLCRGQLGFFRPLGLQPVIEPVAIRALVSGRNLKISVCPVVIRRVPKSGLPRVLLPPHPRKLEYFQSFRSFRRQLPALEPLALTVNPGCNFPFLIGFGALFCGQRAVMGQVVRFRPAEAGLPWVLYFPDHANALQSGNLLLCQALFLIGLPLRGNPLPQQVAVLAAVFLRH